MPHLTFANALPWWAVLLVAAAVASVAWRAYAGSVVERPQRDVLILLRLLTLAALVVFLMRPVRVSDEGSKDIVVPVLVDGSRSMSIEDADATVMNAPVLKPLCSTNAVKRGCAKSSK
jgi:hypothetical protein